MVMAKKNLGAVSAYAIAREQGFTGTKAEWLESLKGEKGEAGEGSAYDDSEIKGKVDDLSNRLGKSEEIQFIVGQNIKLAYNVGNTVPLTPETVSSYRYAIVDCNPNDIFILNCKGGLNPRAYGFLDENNVLISVASANKTYTDLHLSVPKGATKLVINDNKSGGICIHKYGIIIDIESQNSRIEEVYNRFEDIYSLNDRNDKSLFGQLNNVIQMIEPSIFKNKVVEIQEATKYNAWSFVEKLGNGTIVCLYAKGDNHTGQKAAGIWCKRSFNGVVWSNEKLVIDTVNTRDTITGIGTNSNGDVLIFNRVGEPASPSKFEIYKTSDGITFTNVQILLSSNVEIMPCHIGDIIHVENKLIAVWNKYSGLSGTGTLGYGIIESTDDGATWTYKIIEQGLDWNTSPTELSGAYLGNGKILVLGRREGAYNGNKCAFQLESSDYGETWTLATTNLDNMTGITMNVIYDSPTDMLNVYFYSRSSGKLKVLRNTSASVFGNPTAWNSSQDILSGYAKGNDSGNVNVAVINDDTHLATFYSGTATDTGVYGILL